MKSIKLFSFIFIFLLFGFLLGQNFAQAQTEDQITSTTTNEITTELTEDQIDADSLEIEETEVKIPGEKGYWWSNFKNNLQSTFTFSPVKKAELEIKKANLELLVAKKIANNNNDDKSQAKLQEALEKFKAKMASAENRLAKLDENKKEKILEKIDQYNLKQQQLLRDLENKLPEENKEKIIALRKERIEAWYEKNKTNLEERLKNAVNDDVDGSKFKALNTLATLEEISSSLPEEAQTKIQAATVLAQEKLKAKLQNLNTEEKEKFEKYLTNINLNALRKIQLIEKLSTGTLPTGAQASAEQIKKQEVEKIEIEFEALDDNSKTKYLEKNFNDNHANATKIELLKKLEQKSTQAVKEKIQTINEQQEIKLKERIQNISTEAELKMLEQENKNLPVIKKELQEKKYEILKKEVENTRELEKQKLEALKKQKEQEKEALKKQRERERENQDSTDDNEN